VGSASINLNDIPLFVEVARRKSFSLAARALGLPTSTLSRRIGELERSIGLPLINRNTRRVGLTEAGLAYFERCQGLVDASRIAHESLSDTAESPQGILRVATSHSLATVLLPSTIGDFLRDHPEIRCKFDLSMRMPDASRGVFDVMLRLVSSGDPAGMFVRELASVPTYLYASADYLDRAGWPAVPADLASHACIRTTASDSDSYWDLYDNFGQRERVRVSGRVSANNVTAGNMLAGLGLGIARLPQFPGSETAATKFGLRRILAGWQIAPLPLYAVFPSSILPERTRLFMSYVEAALKG